MSFLKFSFFLLFLLFHQFHSFSNENISIKIKINDQIVTNYDLEKEKKYLMALNPNLKNLNNKLQNQIAKDSIAKEIIKKNELKKYFDLEKQSTIITQFIKNFYTNLGIENEINFEKYLNNFGWTLKEVKQKIKIEVLWNQLIFDRYINQVKIDKVKLRNKINVNEKKEFRTLYELSEIIFQIEKGGNLKNTTVLINKSINEIGFENTANLYSISDSSKIGGKIGWVAENSLSTEIFDSLKNLNIGDHTSVINLNSKFIILKLNDVKKEKRIIDKEKELNNLIKAEQNRQLDNYSKIFFDKIKINTKIYEY
tara:strand:+ start:596 stop:1528 length:933 start_codon:yes stop_codon:yes gene_type:complete